MKGKDRGMLDRRVEAVDLRRKVRGAALRLNRRQLRASPCLTPL